MTPDDAHITDQVLIRRWKNSRKKASQTKEQTAFHQHQKLVGQI